MRDAASSVRTSLCGLEGVPGAGEEGAWHTYSTSDSPVPSTCLWVTWDTEGHGGPWGAVEGLEGKEAEGWESSRETHSGPEKRVGLRGERRDAEVVKGGGTWGSQWDQQLGQSRRGPGRSPRSHQLLSAPPTPPARPSLLSSSPQGLKPDPWGLGYRPSQEALTHPSLEGRWRTFYIPVPPGVRSPELERAQRLQGGRVGRDGVLRHTGHTGPPPHWGHGQAQRLRTQASGHPLPPQPSIQQNHSLCAQRPQALHPKDKAVAGAGRGRAGNHVSAPSGLSNHQGPPSNQRAPCNCELTVTATPQSSPGFSSLPGRHRAHGSCRFLQVAPITSQEKTHHHQGLSEARA